MAEAAMVALCPEQVGALDDWDLMVGDVGESATLDAEGVLSQSVAAVATPALSPVSRVLREALGLLTLLLVRRAVACADLLVTLAGGTEAERSIRHRP
jgi:hypothetical protein